VTLDLLQVIITIDALIRPPGPKMMVCVEPKEGIFLRINSEPNWAGSVAIARNPHHPFLKWDSYIECGEPFTLDEYTIYESVRDKGVLGAVHQSLIPAIWAGVDASITVTDADKQAIRLALKC
jgi:hypothetical protein